MRAPGDPACNSVRNFSWCSGAAICKLHSTDRKEFAMGTSTNKDVARRFYEEVLNKRDVDLLDELAATDYVEHDPLPGQGTGLAGLKERVNALLTGLDPTFTIEDVIAEDDRVA